MDTSTPRFRLVASKKEIRTAVEFFASNYSVLQMLRNPNMTVTRGDMFLSTIYISARLETLIRLLSDDPEADLMQLPRPFEMMHGALEGLIQSLRDEGLQLKVHEDGTAEFVMPVPESEPTETDLDTLVDLDDEEEQTEIVIDEKKPKARRKRKKTTRKKKTGSSRRQKR